MGVRLAGSYNQLSLRRGTPRASRRVSGFRRLLALGGSWHTRARPVDISEWRGALDALRDLHRSRPVTAPLDGFLGGLTSVTGRVEHESFGVSPVDAPLLLPSTGGTPMSCSDPSPAAAHAPGAAHKAARSTH